MTQPPQTSGMPASVRGPLPLGEQGAQSEPHHEAPSVYTAVSGYFPFIPLTCDE